MRALMSRMTFLVLLGSGGAPGSRPCERGRWLRRRRQCTKNRAAGVARRIAQLVLDAQQLVVLRDPVGARERAGLDLPGVGRDREVGDGDVLGLARAVGDDRGVAGAV